MPITTNLPNVIEAIGAAESGANGAWQAIKRRDGVDPDLSLQAVQISRIFTEPASVEELQLVQRLFFLPRNEAPQVVVFCGVGPRDGAELVCARAAEILASQVREPVCLVDANLKDATLHQRYDLDTAFSFSGQKAKAERDQASRVNGRNLWVLPANALRESCPGLSPDRVGDQLSRLRERFRFLLICAPPLESAPDGFLLGQMSDGIVLILQAHSTYRTTALKVRRYLETYDIRLLGAVLNQQPASKSLAEYWKARD
jgi:hypothetical protein